MCDFFFNVLLPCVEMLRWGSLIRQLNVIRIKQFNSICLSFLKFTTHLDADCCQKFLARLLSTVLLDIIQNFVAENIPKSVRYLNFRFDNFLLDILIFMNTFNSTKAKAFNWMKEFFGDSPLPYTHVERKLESLFRFVTYGACTKHIYV